ncbi:MAG: hypothetical protein KF744_11005 [Taibaiella sp.]|nr:hypothetical protein [Taibaiella sp.]
MKAIILWILLFFCAGGAFAQPDSSTLLVDIHALRKEGDISKNWRFKEADDPAMANPDYDDKSWDITESFLFAGGDSWAYKNFNSICWLRKELWVDSSVVGVPVAVSLNHLGAAVVYVDGAVVDSFGTIAGRTNTKYESPARIPTIIVFQKPGRHVLAIRYANFNAKRNDERYSADYPGIDITLGLASDVLYTAFGESRLATLMFILFFGIFFALSLAHFFMYMFQRSVSANLYFSIMCMSLALIFLFQWLSIYSHEPFFSLSGHFVFPALSAAFCFSLSAFTNTQFGKKKIRFYVVCALSIAAPLMVYLSQSLIGFAILVNLVMFEAIVLIVRAIFRKVKGAGIVGVGMLLFTVFIFLVSAYLSIMKHVSFNGGGWWAIGIAALAFLGLPVSMSLFLAWSFARVNKELQHNLEQVQELSEKTLQQEQERIRLVESQKEKLETEVAARTAEVVNQKEEIEKQHGELKIEKQRSDDLLLNILPGEIAEELKVKGHTDARMYNDVSVLFTDFVDFTSAGERLSPQELVDELHSCFKAFDEIIQRYGIEKIKTIGDAYLAVAGLPKPDGNHAEHVVQAALEMLAFMVDRKKKIGERTFEVRIGINSGNVVAGIVGIRKFAYDIWGDTVNTAARMEQGSEPGRINISEATYQLVRDKFVCTPRGLVEAKNKGVLAMYFVEGPVER